MKTKMIENVLIIYKNGGKEIFDVISITMKGVYTGKKNTMTVGRRQFIKSSFIPRDQIQRIIISNKSGKTKDLDF